MYLRYNGAEKRPAGDPHPPATNRCQIYTCAWNSGPKRIHGDDAVLVCATWNFVSHARTGRKPTLVSTRRTKYFSTRTTSHRCSSRPVRERNSFSDANSRSEGDALSIPRSCYRFASGTEVVIATVSMSHPSTHNPVSHCEIL